MGDIFNEYLVKRRNGPKQLLYKGLIGLAAIAVMALALYFLGIFALLVIVGVGVGLYFAYKEFDVEYEYCLTNDELDIDRIVSRERRKNVLNVNVRTVEILAPVESEHSAKMKNRSIRRTLDYSSGVNDSRRWFAIYDDPKAGKTLLIFDPPKKMRDGIRTFIPRFVMEPKAPAAEEEK